MRVRLNGEELDTAAATLAAFVLERDFDPRVVATAVNGDFVPRTAREDQRLGEGDAIEVFSPRQGG